MLSARGICVGAGEAISNFSEGYGMSLVNSLGLTEFCQLALVIVCEMRKKGATDDEL